MRPRPNIGVWCSASVSPGSSNTLSWVWGPMVTNDNRPSCSPSLIVWSANTVGVEHVAVEGVQPVGVLGEHGHVVDA